MRRGTLGVALSLAGGAVLAAGAQQPPSFRAATELVVVDVAVVGKDGEPVRGLQASDFAVTIDGKPRVVRTLEYVDESAAPAPGEERPLRPVSSNAPEARGRLVLLLVDEGSLGFGVLPAAARSIERLLAGFGPADKVGLAAMPGPRMLVDFTRDRAAVSEGLRRVAGGAGTPARLQRVNVAVAEAFAIDRGDPTVIEQVVSRECPPSDPLTQRICAQTVGMQAHAVVRNEQNRTSEFVAGLRVLLQQLSSIDAPKLVFVFSQGFTDPDAPHEMADAARLASSARTTIFALRPDVSMVDLSARPGGAFLLTSNEERAWAQSSLDALTGAARGATVDILGSAELPFARIAREVSGYYLVGVESEPGDRDGGFRPIKVAVERRGVTVRSRREVASRPAPRDERGLLARALGSPVSTSDVPLRVSTYNLADDDPRKVRVLVVAEVDRHQSADGEALVGLVFTDGHGRTTGDTGQRMTLPRGESGALTLIVTSSLVPGPYTMKLAVAREGRVGSVEHPFEARVTQAAAGPAADPLQLGELLVMTPASSQRVVPGLDVRVRGDRVVSLAPIGLASPGDRYSFAFEIAREDGSPALVSAPGEVDVKPKGRARFAEATLDVRLLPPGEYRVRLTVLAGSHPVASLFTPFRLDRPGRAAAAGSAGAPAPRTASGTAFLRSDVLDPMVMGPFLEEVAQLSPPSSRPALDLAGSGRIDEAVRLLEPGQPGDPALPFLRGLALFERGDLQPASNEFRAAIAEAPELLVGAFYLGACYAAGGKDAQAIGAWQTSLTALGRYPAVHRFLGDALMRSGQADRARRVLTEAAARWPGDETFRSRVVVAAIGAGAYQQALDAADALVAGQPNDASVLFLAMRSAFQALLEEAEVDRPRLVERLQRYRELYASAGGLQQALVDEWVRFARQ